jgi:hypothetical protein
MKLEKNYLSTYREFLDINERMKKTDVRKDSGKGEEMVKPSRKEQPWGHNNPFFQV